MPAARVDPDARTIVTDVSAARADIERLLASYGLFLDSGDIAACTDLFVDDCEIVVNDGPSIEGRDAVRRFFEDAADHGASGVHLPGPALVDVAPDGKTATAWQGFFFVANGSNTITRGMYRDVAELDADRWRFRRRGIELYPGRR